MTGWWERAACRGMDLKKFFPDKSNQTGPAKEVCATCDVRKECFNDAAAHGKASGVWGGRAWNDGQPEPDPAADYTRPLQRPAEYPPEIRERAMSLFRELRPSHKSNAAAATEVAQALGVGHWTTVWSWVRYAIPADEKPPAARLHAAAGRRRAALAAYHELRHLHPSDNAAIEAVARKVGAHPTTVAGWLRAARTAAAEQQIGAAA